MGQSVLYLMPPVTSSRCSEAHGIGQGTALHRGLERGEIVVDRLARVVTEERGHGVAELTARRVVLQGDADDAGAAGRRLEANRPSVHDVGARHRVPRDQLVWHVVDDLGVPLEPDSRRRLDEPAWTR